MNKSFFAGKKVFITGHTGFKGSWLCHILLRAGAELTGYALPFDTERSLFTESALVKHIRCCTGDVRDAEKLTQAMRSAQPEIVFHLAAQPLVRLSYSEPVLTYSTNVMGTVNILQALRSTPSVRSFVNVTTDKVYENREWYWGYRENEYLNGFDPYSNSKSCSDIITDAYRRSFFETGKHPAISAARAGNVIGGGDYSADRIIPDCVRAALTGKDIILRNPHSVRPYQHVLDCLSGYLRLAEKQFLDAALAGAYNFGPDEDGCVSTGELAALFCTEWGGVRWVSKSVREDVHEANFLKLDCTKAKSVLGWKPRWNIKTAVRKVVEFAKQTTNAERQDVLQKQIKEYFNDEYE